MTTFSTLPPEIHLIIVSHLDPTDKHELSVSSQYLHALIGRVELDRRQTLMVNFRATDRTARGRHHKVCCACVRLLPFYCFFQWRREYEATQIHGPVMCLPCQQRRGRGLIYRNMAMRWYFGECVGLCPECRRLVRCTEENLTRRGGDEGYKLRGIMLRHPNCSYPPPATSLRSTDHPNDPLPLVLDKLALLQGLKERFPVSVLALHRHDPLIGLEGLLPPMPTVPGGRHIPTGDLWEYGKRELEKHTGTSAIL